MKKHIGSALFIALLLIIICSCQPKPQKFNKKNYTAHLNLEKTQLIATEVAKGLEVPWDIVVGLDNWLWYTEQKGNICRVHLETGKIQKLIQLKDVFYRKSTGLFSIVLHPDFKNKPYVYIHYTVAKKGADKIDRVSSKVVRYTFKDEKLNDVFTILDSIPGNTYHNGSRMLINNNKLWIGTGDAGNTETTQNINFLNGKVLRINLDGSIPEDNPYPDNPVWSVGHRNIQGITSGNGKIYISEHGPNNNDEVNIITKGSNYGWPNVHGFCDLEKEKRYCTDSLITEPLKAWTPTIATAGMEFYSDPKIEEWQNSLLLCTLKGRALRVLKLNEDGTSIQSEHIYFQKFLGRIRDVTIGTHGEIYLATSNLDWHSGYQPWMYDSLPKAKGDRIIKLERATTAMRAQLTKLPHTIALKENLKPIALFAETYDFKATDNELENGRQLYNIHCASCHRPDGTGNIGQIPPMVNSEWVSGNTSRLIDVVMHGLSGPIQVNGVSYQDEMPGYQNLEDEQIRDILNYIRVEFGEVRGNIITPNITAQRKISQ